MENAPEIVACEAMTVAAVARITIQGSSGGGTSAYSGCVIACRRLQQHRALPEVVDDQRRPDDGEPGDPHRGLAEVPHVGIQRLAAGHRQKHAHR